MSESNPPVSTGRGDGGTTLLGSGRMSKSDLRIVVLGDATSPFPGLARAEAGADTAGLLVEMQRLVYRAMGDGTMPKEDDSVGAGDLAPVEEAAAQWRGRMEIPRELVVPGESRLGALLDVARSVVRRAKRSLVAAGYPGMHTDTLRIINRLSGLHFIIACPADGKKTLSQG